MRKSQSAAIAAFAVIMLTALPQISAAQTYYDNAGTPIFLPNSSSSYNQNGFHLPNAPTVNGQDTVRGSSGITCQSAVASNGPKLDFGLIGSNDIFDRNSTSVYGRISMPLGKRPKRVDCTKLYELEIQKLKMELQLLRAGSMGNVFDPYAAQQAYAVAADPMTKTRPDEEEDIAANEVDKVPAFTIPDKSSEVETDTDMAERIDDSQY